MKSILLFSTLLFGVIICSLSSCYYDNFEELNPKDTTNTPTCDTVGLITYTKHILPIMNNYCSSCHNATSAGGGVNLSTYEDVKISAQSGKLIGSIIWDGSASKMPKGTANKIENCSIEKIKKWIATGYTQ